MNNRLLEIMQYKTGGKQTEFAASDCLLLRERH
jgi:hypothetical protein